MDPTQSTSTQTPASSSSFATTMASLTPASTLASAVPQPPNPFTLPSKQDQTLAASLKSTSVGAAPVMSQVQQPLSHVFNGSTSGLPVAQGINPSSIQRSEIAPGTQPAADLYPHQINGLGGPTATAPFLQDFNLVAEAAKRAQMGIVMRDLESVTL
ncbi:hypothetical protein N7540_010824 [Penicillium herquei]|nr:hypothetical protein N7540_010824 [Penicillium herquei]